MSRSALSLATSRLSRVISACSAFCWPWPGKACCGSDPNSFTHRRSTVPFTSRSRDACAIVTPRSVTSFTASTLNSRVNLRRSIAHLRFHKTPISVSTEPSAKQVRRVRIDDITELKRVLGWNEHGNAGGAGVSAVTEKVYEETRMSGQAATNLILYGPPGTGKTY